MQRWRAFLEDLQHQLHGHAPAAIDYYGMERAWSLQTNPIPAAPANNYLTQVDKVIGMLRATTN
jgi:hypothetical protein